MSRRDTLRTLIGSVECIAWDGAPNAKGYGRVLNDAGVLVYAHRLSYEYNVGPIPAGMTIDHLCRNKMCVNPRHLEVVSRQENSRRKSFANVCRRGHEFTRENTYLWSRGAGRGFRRVCRTCAAASRRPPVARFFPDLEERAS